MGKSSSASLSLINTNSIPSPSTLLKFTFYNHPSFATMKFSPIALFATLAVATPITSRNTLARRQASEACPIGYCTENGGTTGGAGGDTVTVTTVDALIEAAQSDGPLTIIVSGQLSGNTRVRPTSDKTIFGEAGSCKSSVIPFAIANRD